MRPYVLPLVLIILLLPGPARAASELILGIQPYQPTRALIAYHQKLAEHLQHLLNRPVRIVTAKDQQAFGQRLLEGDYDVVLAPGHLVRLAQVDHGWHPLARYVPDTPVLLLARRTDTQLTVASLKGRIVALPEPTRLVRLATESWLASHHLVAGRDFQVLEADSVGIAVHAVITGEADVAAATLADVAQVRRSEVEQVRIVQETASVPLLFFAARPTLPALLRATLQDALLRYRTPQGVRAIAVTSQSLAAMDSYLARTRELFEATPQPTALPAGPGPT